MGYLYLINDTAEVAFQPVRGYLPFPWQERVDNVGLVPEQDFCLGFKAVKIRNGKGISAGLEDRIDAVSRRCSQGKGRRILFFGGVIFESLCQFVYKLAQGRK